MVAHGYRRLIPATRTPVPNLFLATMTQIYPQVFARYALAQDDVEVLEVLDTEQPTVETHRLDSLMRVRLNGTEVLSEIKLRFTTADIIEIDRL